MTKRSKPNVNVLIVDFERKRKSLNIEQKLVLQQFRRLFIYSVHGNNTE